MNNVGYNREKRKQYIDSFSKDQKPDLSNETSEQWGIQDIVNEDEKSQINNEPKDSQKNKSKKPKTRVGLVPKNLVLHINNPKLNKIFQELPSLYSLSDRIPSDAIALLAD